MNITEKYKVLHCIFYNLFYKVVKLIPYDLRSFFFCTDVYLCQSGCLWTIVFFIKMSSIVLLRDFYWTLLFHIRIDKRLLYCLLFPNYKYFLTSSDTVCNCIVHFFEVSDIRVTVVVIIVIKRILFRFISLYRWLLLKERRISICI